MKQTHTPIRKLAIGVAFLFTAITAAPAAVTFAVDMDTMAPGIQSSITVAPATPLTVDLWATVDMLGLSSFSVSVMFDTLELAPLPPGTAVSQPLMPGGLAPLAFPDETMEPMGLIKSINGATFMAGPASTSFIIGSISFVATGPFTDGIDDVALGYFSPLVDGAFDSGGLPAAPTFIGGKVDLIPEPGRPVLLVLGVLGTLFARRRSQR